jgi:tRNA (guanine-N7-)-methyltransferase
MKRLHHEMEEEPENDQPVKRVNMPKKNKHRMHAHINPFNALTIAHPRNTRFADWSLHYPSFYAIPNNNDNKIVVNTGKYQLNYDKEIGPKAGLPVPQILDIGCGYGGLMFELTKHFQDELILGLEIRDKVANFAGEKVNSIRNNSGNKLCLNVAVLRTNAMKSLHNYFEKESVSCPLTFVTSCS